MTTLPVPRVAQSRAAKGVWAGLILAVSMTTIDQTIVALSGPSIQDHLSIGHAGLQWAVNAYLLTTASFFLLGGRLADVFGHRRMALIGIIGFGVTSLLCGLTPEGPFAAPWLITARALQGVTGALMFPAAIGVVAQTFPQERRGRAMATFFTITGAMTAIGPVAGGYLTQWTWRSIFWINVPIAVAAAILTVRVVPRTKGRAQTIDWRGATVSAVAMALVVFGLQQAGAWGWTSPGVWTPIGIGVVLLVWFVSLERRTAMPLINLRVMRDRGFAVSSLAMFFASIAFISVFFFLSIYGQVSLELSAGNTGLLLLKFFVGFAVAARLGSARFDRQGPRSVVLMGGVVGAVSFAWLARTATELNFDASSFFNHQTWPLLVAGAGIGLMSSSVSTDALNRAIGASYGEVSAITQTMKNFGGALGLALFSTLVTNRLMEKLTDTVLAIGGTPRDAERAVDAVTGADFGSAKSLGAGHAPVLQAVQTDYASAAQVAFYAISAAMVVVAVLALCYSSSGDTREASRNLQPVR